MINVYWRHRAAIKIAPRCTLGREINTPYAWCLSLTWLGRTLQLRQWRSRNKNGNSS